MMLLAVYAVAGVFVVCAVLVTLAVPGRYRDLLALQNTVAAAVVLALAGLTHGIYYNHDGYFGDFWTATEALNKARQGLLSSVDFFSPIGPAYYWTFQLTASLTETVSASSIMHAGAIAGALSAGMAVLMLYRRMSVLGLSIAVFSVVTVATSGRGNGEQLQEMALHFLAPYNRWAWALFIPVALRLSLPARGRDLTGDIVTGVAVALLLLTKVTYGAALIGLLSARVVLLLPRDWLSPAAVFGALATALVVAEAATGQVSAHLQDLAATASLPDNALRIGKFFNQLGEMAIYLLIAVTAYLVSTQRTDTLRMDIASLYNFLTPIIMIALVAGAGCAVLSQNHYSVEAAVYPLLPLIALEWTGALRRENEAGDGQPPRARILTLSAVLVMVFLPVVDFGMHVGQRVQYALNGPDPAFSGTPYADLRFEPFLVGQGPSKLNTVADGYAGTLEGHQALLSAGAAEDGAGRVLALNFANPFPMMLDQPSPDGSPIWMHEGRSFSRDMFVPPEELFRGVDYVMVTLGPSSLWDIYGSTVEADFQQIFEGQYWRLFRRVQ
jgi:hypothetical protein